MFEISATAMGSYRFDRVVWTRWRHAGFLALTLSSGACWAEDVDATLQWARRVELSTPVSGVVVEISVQRGERVKKDQALLRLDTRVRQANVDQARAQLERRTRLRDEAQRELDRAQELYNGTLLSNHDLELARVAFADAEAEYQKAKAGLISFESELNYSVVRAPFDGIVVQRYVEVGQTVVTQFQAVPLIVVADGDRMVATTTVQLRRLRKLKEGQQVAVKVAGRRYEGKIVYMALEPVRVSREGEATLMIDIPDDNLYPINVLFDPKGSPLRAGQPAYITLP